MFHAVMVFLMVCLPFWIVWFLWSENRRWKREREADDRKYLSWQQDDNWRKRNDT
jgi:hypothetical protein